MPSTSLEMRRNRFRPGLCPGPHWGSLQRSLRPLAGGQGARRVLPKNTTPSSALRASAIQATLCRPQHPTKINPSYGLGKHTHYIIFGRPPIGGKLLPFPLAAPLPLSTTPRGKSSYYTHRTERRRRRRRVCTSS